MLAPHLAPPEPTWEIVGDELPDDGLEALARLLVDAALDEAAMDAAAE